MSDIIIFVDRKQAKGGGQVVLEQLISNKIFENSIVYLLTSNELSKKMIIGKNVKIFFSADRIFEDIRSYPNNMTVALCSNTNSDLQGVARLAKKIRDNGRPVKLISIVHSYPRNIFYRKITKFLQSQYNICLSVEPGISCSLPVTDNPPWLSICEAGPQVNSAMPTRKVKTFARPDRVKGLDIVPDIYRSLEEKGLICRVALGESIDGDTKYEKYIRRSLSPWLEEFGKGPDWVEAGDIVLIPSLSETACLTAQEVISRGAYVVSSRVGILPYLFPEGGSIQTFPAGDISGALAAFNNVLSLDENQFCTACVTSSRIISSRAGLWYKYVANRLQSL
ncbi:MAG: glycosyltransferase [Propionibacteriaceae bacterium]|jgi:glycosyltransferase involved in cell wall biosynthesis|nr:glycosyltransferase [Propionibacteriaceae bacterium]